MLYLQYLLSCILFSVTWDFVLFYFVKPLQLAFSSLIFFVFDTEWNIHWISLIVFSLLWFVNTFIVVFLAIEMMLVVACCWIIFYLCSILFIWDSDFFATFAIGWCKINFRCIMFFFLFGLHCYWCYWWIWIVNLYSIPYFSAMLCNYFWFVWVIAVLVILLSYLLVFF